MTDSFALIDCISDCCIVVNGKGVVEKCNDAIQELTGYSKVELAGKSINTLIQSEFHNQHDLLLQNYFSGPKKRKMGAGQSIHCVHKNETLIPVEISLNPVEVNGQWFVMVVMVDLRLFNEKERLLMEENAKLHSILRSNQDHIFQIDRNFIITYINHVSPGLEYSDVFGKDLRKLWPKTADLKGLEAKIQSVFDTGEANCYEIQFPVPSGSIHYRTLATPVFENGRVERITLVSKDETKETYFKGQLLSKNRFIDKINEHSINGIYIYDLTKGLNTFVNRQYTNILGYTIQDINGLSQEEFSKLFHPEDIEAIHQHMMGVMAGKENETFEITYRFKSKMGEWVWCHSVDVPFECDSEGKVLSFMGCFVDVTPYKRIEGDLLVKSKEIENFVYIVSHDIKSPLSNIMQCLELLSQCKSEDRESFLKLAAQSTQRLFRLVHSLLDYSVSSAKRDCKVLRLREALREVEEDLGPQIKNHQVEILKGKVDFEFSYSENAFYQLLLNLIGNSIKYRKPDQSPRIKVDVEELIDFYRFCICDNGVGIPEKERLSIFEIFSRISNSRKIEGVGIGLATCKKIVECYGGNIWVEKSSEEGTEICFTIPKNL